VINFFLSFPFKKKDENHNCLLRESSQNDNYSHSKSRASTVLLLYLRGGEPTHWSFFTFLWSNFKNFFF